MKSLRDLFFYRGRSGKNRPYRRKRGGSRGNTGDLGTQLCAAVKAAAILQQVVAEFAYASFALFGNNRFKLEDYHEPIGIVIRFGIATTLQAGG